MAHLLNVDGANASVLQATSMTAEGLSETDSLEAWIKKHPEVIDETLMVVTTQFNSWESGSDVARERPDVLALATSGELVVIELKRDRDRRIHLQAITYGALVAGFTKEILADAHAEWLRKESGRTVTAAEALQILEDHVEPEWSEDLFQLPRLVLVAERFPAQVLTTVQWLSAIAPNMTIECHEYQLFNRDGDILASFQKLYPVDDLESRRLRPMMTANTTVVRDQLTTNTRRAKSVTIIDEFQLIPDGSSMTFSLEGLVRTESVQKVEAWLAEDAERSSVSWASHPVRPLRWALEPGKTWTPSSLRDEIFKRAGLPKVSFSAADAWQYEGTSLYWLADSRDSNG
ncbi:MULTISPECIES: hypothetical protein [unclassified Frondihabitans]|uniref:hypothetical protein n=1 Tax=unclassified Frondihabitans TaxID=2626248 RepID=UPI000F4FCE91|nr:MULTISPECIES: hypothetical protein [unclassified Frondihabitans]RPE77872.1 hypothetical protein EDF37_0537 [Frondihabitans sp. PhB153]RPF08151.1 hypothetical protein EDF39_0538 [Frondihabitans sp. PhB161]